MTVIPDFPTEPQIEDATKDQLDDTDDQSAEKRSYGEADGEQKLIDLIERPKTDPSAQSHAPMRNAPKGNLNSVVEYASRKYYV